MFGLMEGDGIRWKGVESLKIPLFACKNEGWKGMEENGIYFTISHYIMSF